jgi:hypothetical protein
MTSAEWPVHERGMRRPASRAGMGPAGGVVRRRHLAAVEPATGAAARRVRLERTLAVTEAQFQSVDDQIAHLTRFRRILDRYVRALRIVIAAEAAAASHGPVRRTSLRPRRWAACYAVLTRPVTSS